MDSPSKKPSHRSQSFVLPGEGGVSKRDVLSRNESHTSFHSLSGPTLSDGVDGGPSQPGTPLKQASLEPHLTELDRAKRKDENLYFWMQRQFVDYRLNMSYFSSLPSYEGGMGGSVGGVGAVSGGRLGAGPTGLSTSRIGASELSQEDKLSIQKLMALHQTSFTVADAQTLFKPLLVSMGLKLGEVKTSALMKKLGCHLSVKIIMSSLRIDIVDSENSPKRNKGKGKGKRTFLPMFYINTNLDTPAFYCDRFKVRMGVKDIVNFESENTSYTQEHESKFAFDSLIAKPTTTKANLILNIHSINQHVNMSLLRLLHQFVTMIENINDTRAELKGLTSTDAFKGHRKQDSKGSSSDTGAESVGTGLPEFPNFSRSDIEMPLPQYDEGRRAKNDTTSLPVLDSAVSPPPPQSRPDKLQLPAPGMHAKRLFAKSNMYELLSTKSTPEMYGEAEFPDSGFDKGIDIELGATADTSSPAVVSSEDKTMVQEIKQSTPQCWRNLYALVNLYATVPQPRTITKPATSRLSVIDEEPDKASQSRSFDVNSLSRLRRLRAGEDPLERQPLLEAETPITPSSVPSSSIYARAYPTATVFNQSVLMGERVPLVIFGVMCVKQVRMSAMLSGLKLEADLSNFNASATHRQKIKGVTKRRSEETSVTANVGHTMIALLEGVAPNMQTVVTVNVAQSQGLYSGLSRRGRLLNQCLLTVGLVDIDIPQHPGVLHGMVSRSSKRLSSTLQEFIRRPTKSKSAESATEAAATPSAQASRQSDVVDGARLTADPQKAGRRDEEDEEDTPKPLLINFKAVLKGLAVGASLLPSLRAQYQMGKVISSGLTGKKARFIVDLPTHSLSFSSKVSTPLNLPSFASVELPPIHMHAEYRVQPEASAPAPPRDYLADGLGEGLEFRPGNFLYAVAEVGLFQHCLATDLLNHLVFVQKVFMKEINEVVQKISGVDQPVSIWGEDVQQAPVRPLLYSLHFRLKGMEITATTPTSSAVRLETGVIDLDVSNRVQSARSEPTVSPTARHRLKPFVKLQLELKLALGSLLKNPIFVEADAEFQQLATFATRINMRNALQHEMIPGSSKDQEALMILLQRPVVSVMPTAFDKAVLVWLNYKNAYEYWTEQRLAQIQDMTPAGSSAWGKAGSTPIAESAIPESAESNPTQESSLTSRGSNVEGVQAAAAQALGTLFLQLTVDDLGICLPIGNTSQSLGGVGRVLEDAGTPALVLTLESTQISACSCGSLVSKGRFKGFCLRFASDFEVSWDDWKPDRSLDVVMNAMVVPCGTYEVCSRTKDATSKDPLSNAKWILNIKWEMEGMVIHLDTNIGKRLSALGDTLTTLGVGEPFNTETESAGGGGGGSEDEEDDVESSELEDFATANEAAAAVSRKISTIPEGLPAFMYDISLDTKTRARFIEQEMNEQAKTVEDLKQLGASQGTIEAEERKLIEFEKAVFDDFRQDLWKKLRKQGAKTAVIKDKLGLGYKPAHSRSRSIGNHPGVPRPEPASRGMTLFNEDKSTTLFDAAITESESDSSIGHQRALSLDVSAMAKGRSFDDVLPPLPHATQSDTDVRKQARRSELAELRNQQIMEDSASTSSDEETPVIQLSRSKRTVPDTTTHIPPPPPPSKAPPSSPTAPPTTTEPMVDFEVDIKVDISRGRCVVHPKEPKTEDEPKSSSKKEVIGGSPRSERKKAARKLDSSGRGFGQADNTTVFYLPGIDIKVHYESKLVPIEERTSPSSSMKRDVQPPSFADVTNLNSGTLVKKGNMYAWISLQQLSEEMMISPTLLDFLEQALEPIPVTQLLQPKTPASPGTAPETPMSSSTAVPPMDLDTIAASLGPANSAASTSFPVDVVVYIRVQPSLIRFTCLPVSRVQCLLRLPSFDVVFSTKKADVIGSQLGSQDPLNQSKRGESLKRPGSGATLHTSSTNVGGGGGLLQRSGIMASRARRLSGVEQDPSSGGLSVTACISDFSLNVFHPYGGSTARREPAFTKRPGTLRDSLGSPGSEPGRKDSLSLVVEFVKVNISRTRKGLVHSESMHKYFDTRAANIVRFSTLCDVGSASFNYDMRRLPEILALPKAWYRRTLARRLFLGEETAFMDSESGEDEFSLSSGSTPSDPLGSSLQRYSLLNETGKERARSPGTEERTGGAALADTKRNTLEDKYRKFKTPTDSVPQSPRLASPTGPPRSVQELLSGLSQTSPRRIIPMSALHSAPGDKQQAFSGFSRKQASQQWSGPAGGAAAQRAISEWETLVLFAVNLSQLHVTVNMSNVMGNTVWRTRDLKAQGQLLIDSSGYRNMHITAGLAGSKLEAKGGIVGGYIEIDRQEALLSIKEDPGRQPDHCVGLELCAIEIKLDYMGSSVLMNRFSGLRVQLNDEWLVDAGRDSQQPLATNRPAQIFVHGLLAWDKFHLMLSRSTTPDLLKMVNKLEEFFSQQLTSGKRALLAMGTLPLGRGHRRKNSAEESSWISEIRHHRHWQQVLERIAGCKFTNLTFVLPQQGTILGGSMNLHGNNITLACFHGINFRSKSWALFTMEEPLISFSTESQDLVDDAGERCTHIIQQLTFQLGDNMVARGAKRHMAYICKLSRGHYMPPPFTNVTDWFHYAFSTNEIKDLDSFPTMARMEHWSVSPGADADTTPSATAPLRSMSRGGAVGGKKGTEHADDTEVIFMLPLFQMHLNTLHLQGVTEPQEGDPQPVVECSFVTEFEDHIFVAMDVEVLLFLHDLVMSYVKERDKGSERKLSSPDVDKKNIANPTTVLKLDYRHFRCNTWILEPTIRLISWAGNRIEPVGVDYILQKLGFQHARLTVPKWMQRGCMDPLDKLLSILIDKLIVFLKQEEEEEGAEQSSTGNASANISVAAGPTALTTLSVPVRPRVTFS